jgi:hypothetical protein
LKNLIINSPTKAVHSAAAIDGVTLISPATVNRLFQKNQRFNDTARLNLIDLHYTNAEELFLDLQHFSSGIAIAGLHGKPNVTDLRSRLSVNRDVGKDFIYVGPDVQSLHELLEWDESALTKFNGVKVDSTYLLAKTGTELTRDAATLAKLGLKIVIDLRRDQMHHDGIALYPHIPNYESGMQLYQEILDKMRTLGAADLIVRIQDVGGMRNSPKYIAQRDATWNTFAELAQARSIKLHLIFDSSLKFSPAAGFSGSNVFVIQGSKGTPSPFRLLKDTKTTGSGTVTIHDEDGGCFASGDFMNPRK